MRKQFLKSGYPSEDSIHIAIIEWLQLNPKVASVVFHIPNGGKRNPREASKLKRMGIRRGASDLFIMRARHGFNGAFIELKTKGGKLSPEQQQFLQDAENENYYTAVTWSLDEALEQIEWYLLK